jgi:hypothetical protein
MLCVGNPRNDNCFNKLNLWKVEGNNGIEKLRQITFEMLNKAESWSSDKSCML